MKLFKLLFDSLAVVLLNLVLVRLGPVKKHSGFSSISNENLITIGDYLPCPQKELGYLNRFYPEFYVDKYHHGRVLAERYNFPEFKNLTSPDIFYFFKHLAFIDDPVYIFESFLNFLRKNPSLKNPDKRILFNFIKTKYSNLLFSERLTSSNESLNSRYFQYLINFLIDIEAYNELVSVSLFDPWFFTHAKFKKLNQIRLFLQSIMNVNDSLYEIMKVRFRNIEPFEKSGASAVLYRYLLNKASGNQKVKFMICSKLFDVPEDWFMAQLEANFAVNPALIGLELVDEDLKLKLKIHDTYNGLISTQLVNQANFGYYLLLNNIKFGGQVELEHFVTELNRLNLNSEKIANVIEAVLFGNQDLILEKLYHGYGGIIEDLMTNYPRLYVKIITRLLVIMNDSEKEDLRNNRSVFKSFLYEYQIYDMKVIVSNYSGISFLFTLKTDQPSLPDSFVFTLKFNENEIVEFVQSLSQRLFTSKFHDQYSISNIFKSFEEYELIKDALIGREPIYASYATLTTISLNQDLLISVRRSGIKFELSFDNSKYCAKLFDTSIIELVGILIVKRSDWSTFLANFNFTNQFGNFDEFLGQVLFAKAVKSFFESYPNFFKYRLVLRYLLKHPNRELLQRVKVTKPEYLKKFVLELDSEEAQLSQI